ncbi:MAG: ABC transporter permease [Flavobacteriaceae bacterium]|nr:ABC transporter permease [Flavobacteriaceae bacterium]
MVAVPLFCLFFFTSLMSEGLPTNLPTGVVDNDNSRISQSILRKLDALEETEIIGNYKSITKAREAVQRGEIYGFYYIPKDFSKDVQAQRQPKVSFYTNNAYLVAGSLLFKDMKKMSELASAGTTQKILLAKGTPDEKIMANLRPIVVEGHALKNPWLNYSVYLNNILLPGILSLMIFLMTVYAIGVEIKDNTAREWLAMGNHSIIISLVGKLFLQTLLFQLVGAIYCIYLYEFLGFPLNNGILPIMLAMLCLIIASQAFGIFFISLMPTLRMGLSLASLWGMVSFSISGFSFPSMGMLYFVQGLSYLFPLRHYYLIYASQALNGYPVAYAFKYYVFLLLFIALPFITAKRLKRALIYFEYIP